MRPFARAVTQVAQAVDELLGALVTNGAPRDREIENAKARAKAAIRFPLREHDQTAFIGSKRTAQSSALTDLSGEARNL